MRSKQERELEKRNPRAARVDFLMRKAAARSRGGDVRKSLWVASSGSGSSGGGYCVSADSFMADGRRAREVREGDLIEALSDDLLGLRLAVVEQVRFRIEPCVRLRTRSGELDVSCPTRLVQPGGFFVRADHAGGHLIRMRRLDGVLHWEAIEEAAPIGDVEVAKISAGEVNYAAGRAADVMFYPHNIKKEPDDGL